MKNAIARVVSTGVVMVLVLLALSANPTQAAITYGRWRDINPAQYSSDVTGTIRGIAMRSGGSGAIGAGDGWAVGGDCPGGTCSPVISHYDGFSWPLLGSPVATAEWNGVNFCDAPGAPGVGLCSPNGDGSDGWIVGTDGTIGRALFWNGQSLTEADSSTGNGLALAKNLTSVFVACHQQLPSDSGGGCSGISNNALVVAAGQTTGSVGGLWEFAGTDSGVNPGSGSWSSPLPISGSSTTQYNGVFLFAANCPSGPCLGGYAVGNGGVIAVLGVGGTWTASTQPGCTTHDLIGVFVYSVSGSVGNAIAVGRGGIICQTTDGAHWSQVAPGITSQDLTGIFMVSSSEAWIVGQQSVIIHTTCLFCTANTVPMTVPADTGSGLGITLMGVSFTGGGNGWAAGTSGVILQTANGACGSLPSPGSPLACWGGSTSITQSPVLNAVFENSPNDAWAGGNITTLDGSIAAVLVHWDGTRWHRSTISPLITNPNIQGLYFTGGGDGWAVGGVCPSTGTCTGTGVPAAFHWGGGGTTHSNEWDGIGITPCLCSAMSVFMSSGGYPGGDGWAVGTAGNIWHFSAGSFGGFASPTTNGLFSVFVENPGSNTIAGFAAGAAGTILKLYYTGSGPTWSLVGPINGVTADLHSVYFKDSNHGWIVGGSSTQPAVILTTTDGGVTWSGGPNQVTGAPTGLVLYSVFVDTVGTGAGNGDGWAVGQDGSGNFVMAHYDGVSWQVAPLQPPLATTPNPGLGLRSVSLTNPQDGWAVGAGITGATNPLAGIFHLDPLYPPVVGQQANTTTTTSSSSSSTESTASSSSSVSSTSSTTSTPVTSTSSLTTTMVSTSVSTFTLVSTPTTTTSSSSSTVSTPLVMPAIPGFPWESIIAGLMLGITGLAIARRRKN